MAVNLSFLSGGRRGDRRIGIALLFQALAEIFKNQDEEDERGNIEAERPEERVPVKLPWTPLGG